MAAMALSLFQKIDAENANISMALERTVPVAGKSANPDVKTVKH